MSTARTRVLVVEDDDALRDAVAAALTSEGYEVHGEPDGMRLAQLPQRPDLAVLDVRLGAGPSGLSVARLLRAEADVPILFLSAADSLEDRVAGFEAGADDYLVKPFSMTELLLRVRALLRRSGRATNDRVVAGDVELHRDARTASYFGHPVDLTRTEFDILAALARRPGRVVGKAQLMAEVWGFTDYDPNLVEVHVSALRRKLEAHGPRVIQTVRGVGYVLRS